MKNFFYCHDCLAGFFSEAKAYDCPCCETSMAVSGWMSGVADNSPEKGSEGSSDSLPA